MSAPGRGRFAVGLRLAVLPVLVFAFLLALPPALRAQAFETKAEYAILVDVGANAVLFQHRADEPMPPASLAKLMTAVVVFDALKAGRLGLDDEFLVSENAWRSGGGVSGGSTMFAKVGSSIAVRDLLRGVIVQSGNDACIVLAEGMAGTEAAFAALMNRKAKQLGLTGSNFRNSTGLPDPEQYTTARDLAKVAEYLIESFPEHYSIYSEKEFTWNKITQKNRNPLLEMNIGADGLKTGFTEESGYGLVGSAVRGERRLIVVINGAKSERARAEEGRKLLEWGFRAFEGVALFGNGEIVAEANVYGGDKAKVGLVSKGPIEVMLPAGSLDTVIAKVTYKGPIQAPVAAGTEVGHLKVWISGELATEAPLFAAEDIERGALHQRALDAVGELVFGWW